MRLVLLLQCTVSRTSPAVHLFGLLSPQLPSTSMWISFVAFISMGIGCMYPFFLAGIHTDSLLSVVLHLMRNSISSLFSRFTTFILLLFIRNICIILRVYWRCYVMLFCRRQSMSLWPPISRTPWPNHWYLLPFMCLPYVYINLCLIYESIFEIILYHLGKPVFSPWSR